MIGLLPPNRILTNFKKSVNRKSDAAKSSNKGLNKPIDEVTFPLTDTNKYNLRRYNRRRHELLIRIPEPPKPKDDNEIALQ